MAASKNKIAVDLFAPIAKEYERWSRILSFGQDPQWRKQMVGSFKLAPGAKVLDVAAGTGEVTRLLAGRDYRVVSLDQSPEMLAEAAQKGAVSINGRAEALPFADDVFDGLTFTYLLRYVENPASCMKELVRVVRPGGMVGMVEFGRPRRIWGGLWWFYTRAGLPAAGALIGSGWQRVGAFLGPSIDEFHHRYPEEALIKLWEDSGLENIKVSKPSLQGGLIMWGQKS